MRRIVTAAVAALEALAIALAGLAIVALPVALLWALRFGLALEPGVIAALIGATWLLSTGVPLRVALDEQFSAGLGLAPEKMSFVIDLMPLGLTALTLGFAARAGWRLGAFGARVAGSGILAGALGFGAAAWLVAAQLPAGLVEIPIPAAAGIAAGGFAAAALIGAIARSGRDGAPWLFRLRSGARSLLGRAAAPLGRSLWSAGRLIAATVALIVALAAAGFTLALLTGYVDVVTLSQQLHLDFGGLISMFLINLAFLPTFLVWTLAWFVGPGFAIGAGSSVTPFGTQLGPVPSLPVFGALPDGWGSAGLVAPILIGLCALIAAVFLLGDRPGPRWLSTAGKARTGTESRQEPASEDQATEPLDGLHEGGDDASVAAEDTADLPLGEHTSDRAATPEPAFPTLSVLLAVPLAAIGVGVLLWVLGLAASGGFGPGRLQTAGPAALPFAAYGALEAFLGAAIGALIVRVDWNDRVTRSRRRLASLPAALGVTLPGTREPASEPDLAAAAPEPRTDTETAAEPDDADTGVIDPLSDADHNAPMPAPRWTRETAPIGIALGGDTDDYEPVSLRADEGPSAPAAAPEQGTPRAPFQPWWKRTDEGERPAGARDPGAS